jgi:hypothetical protein
MLFLKTPQQKRPSSASSSSLTKKMIPTKSFPVGGEDDENKKQKMETKIAFGTMMISQQKRWVTLLYLL